MRKLANLANRLTLRLTDYSATSRLRLLRGTRRLARGREGQALIEVAVVLPVFILLVFGLFIFTMALISYMSMNYAARAGARYASMHSLTSTSPATNASVTAVVRANLYMPNSPPATVQLNYGNRSGINGNYIGDDLGVLVIWQQTVNIPFYGSKTFYMSNQAYRFITR